MTMMNKPVGIIGTGSFLPDNVVTNFDLEKMVDTNDQWIRERTGIEERRIAPEYILYGDRGSKKSYANG